MLQMVKHTYIGSGILCYFPPKVVTVFYPAVSYQHITGRIPIGCEIQVRSITQFHPAIIVAGCPHGAITVQEPGQPAPALPSYQGFVENSITLKIPVGNGQVVTQSLPAVSKKYAHEM